MGTLIDTKKGKMPERLLCVLGTSAVLKPFLGPNLCQANRPRCGAVGSLGLETRIPYPIKEFQNQSRFIFSLRDDSLDKTFGQFGQDFLFCLWQDFWSLDKCFFVPM